MPMLGISAAELASIQADLVAAVCDKTCQIYRDLTAGTPDAYGSSSSSPTNTGNYVWQSATVAGMSQPSGGELQNYAYEIEDKDAWTVRLPVGTNVTHRDHLLVGPVPGTAVYPSTTLYPDSVQTLEVHILLTPISYQGLLSVIAAEIK